MRIFDDRFDTLLNTPVRETNTLKENRSRIASLERTADIECVQRPGSGKTILAVEPMLLF